MAAGGEKYKLTEDSQSFSDIDLTTKRQSNPPDQMAPAAPVRAESENEQLLIQPHSQLPQPEAPSGLLSSLPRMNRSRSLTERVAVDVPAIGKYLRDRSNSFSAAIARKLYSSFKEEEKEDDVTEITLRGVKVIVKLKSEQEETRRIMISFFSRSNCRDCRAVRSLFREKGLNFVEINLDVYPEREKELVARTGTAQVPQIFFNDKLFGGLVALNSLRNTTGDDFQRMMEEMLKSSGQEEGAQALAQRFDDEKEENQVIVSADDEMLEIVRVVRQKLSIQDRLVKIKIVKNCFVGSEMVEVLIHHLDCGRNKAIEIGKQLGRKHFIHHVFGENEFEDGNNNLYRLLEHEPYIYKCYNFRGSMNEHEPKPVSEIGLRMTKIMVAILEAYASDDQKHIDYVAIRKSQEFQRYLVLSEELHRVVDLKEVTEDERLAFFLNLYNAMAIHAVIRVGLPTSIIDRRSHFSDFQYLVGGYPYTLSDIKNGILRNNRRPPYSLVKPFATTDKRLELAVEKVNPLINLGLCSGARSSPPVRFFTAQGVEAELRCAAREFFQSGGVEVDLDTRTVTLTRLIKWFRADFGQDKEEMLMWIMDYLDAPKAGLLTHLLGDSGPINIVYQNYDWSINS